MLVHMYAFICESVIIYIKDMYSAFIYSRRANNHTCIHIAQIDMQIASSQMMHLFGFISISVVIVMLYVRTYIHMCAYVSVCVCA